MSLEHRYSTRNRHVQELLLDALGLYISESYGRFPEKQRFFLATREAKKLQKLLEKRNERRP